MMRTRGRLWGVVLALALVSLTACGETHRDNPAQWIGEVRRAHEGADGALATGSRSEAIQALEAAAAIPAPDGVQPEHARAVAQDLRYRLSRLRLANDDAQGALTEANAGIALGIDDTVMSANLLVARGEARERLGRTAEAAADYHRALMINEALLDIVLEDGGEAPRAEPRGPAGGSQP